MTARSIIRREFIHIDEAAEMAKCTIDDLFSCAERGELTIYVVADKWSVGRVYGHVRDLEIFSSEDLEMQKYTHHDDFVEISVEELAGAENTEDFDQLARKYAVQHRKIDTLIGNRIVFGDLGFMNPIYDTPLDDRQPIAKSCFKEYRIRADQAEILLDLNHMFDRDGINIHGLTCDCFVSLSNSVLVRDMLNSRKLVLKSSDLDELTNSGLSDGEDKKPSGAVRRETLLKLVIGMAMRGYGYNPEEKRSDKIPEIETDLDQCGLSLDQDTIRKALREAVDELNKKKQRS